MIKARGFGRLRHKKQKTRDLPAEASLDDWVEWGGQRIWAVDFTAGGAPIGLTEEQMAAAEANAVEWKPDWVLAEEAIERALRGWTDAGVKVGRVKRLAQGLSRRVFVAEVAFKGGETREVAALVPWRDELDLEDPELNERTGREARILAELGALRLPFRVPKVYGVMRPDGVTPVLVASFERGIELDLRAGRQPVKPWEIVGTIAAAVHRLPASALSSLRARYRDRREHAQASLAAFDDTPSLQADAARTWILNHLPEPEPCVPVHGDLLDQNILRGLDEPDAVVDWEYAELGDPAYELAIVTRGARKPFQLAQGLEHLLEAYAHAGGAAVDRCTYRFTSSRFRPSCIETHSRRRAKPRPNNNSSF